MINNNNMLISVAMATYNGERYIAAQLNSIINQTYSNIEIIIVDDYSSDATPVILRQYQSNYNNIQVFKNPVNQGIVKSFETAIGLCNGEYIALADQDDVWFQDKLEKLVNNIEDNLLIHSDAVLVDDNMQLIAASNVESAKKDKFKSGFIDYLISNNVTGCTALFPRKLIELALPIPAGFYVHDHYLALIASFYGKVKFLDESLIYYRQHSNNSIGAKRPDFNNFIQHCHVIANSYDILLSMHIFKHNMEIELLRDYRLSMYLGVWTSKFSIFRLLKIKHGIKLYAYYLLVGGVCGRKFSRKVYNFIYKIN